MSKIFLCVTSVLLIFSMLALAGCAMVQSPVNGYLVTEIRGPITATSSSTYSKKGTASCTSVFGLFAYGNASIEAAAKQAGITKIHHIDYGSSSFFGIYATFKVYVYGE